MNPTLCFETTFRTPFGRCAIAWNQQALVALRLPAEWADKAPPFEPKLGPHYSPDEDEAPGFVCEAAQRVLAHLEGRVPNYDDLPVDLSGLPRFTQEVLWVVRRISPGETRTYQEVARDAGRPEAARAVGQAVRANPLPLIIPCHRVVAASGSLGGFSAPGGLATKRWLLRLEGTDFRDKTA